MLFSQLSCNKLNLYRSDGTKTSESGLPWNDRYRAGGGAGGGRPGGGGLRTISVPGGRRLERITIGKEDTG